jgi:hypothetical protein
MAKLKIKELSHKDILKLSEKDLKNMINFRMAEEGLKIMLPPVEPELVQIPEEDVTLYSFQGLNLSFTTIQEAEYFFKLGFEAMIEKIKPTLVLVVGEKYKEYISERVQAVHYPSYMKQQRENSITVDKSIQ